MEKQAASNQKTPQSSKPITNRSAAGPNSLAVLPPAYGMSFLDSGFRLSTGQPLQTKLTISQPGDIYEREADRIADQVMRMSQPQIQRRCTCGGIAGPDGECESCKQKRLSIQRKANHTSKPEVAPTIVNEALHSSSQPLDIVTRTFMEPRFGVDFSGVRVHTDAKAAESARAINALAYTVGTNVVFGAGQYAPHSNDGQRLIAHELTHVVQQGQGEQQVQRKKCKFYVYDSTEPTGMAWKWRTAALTLALPRLGAYVIESGEHIEDALHTVLSTYASKDCDCTEEIQFWSHGSSGNAMSITKTNEELTSKDFDIPELKKYGYGPTSMPGYQEWHSKLSPRQRRLVLLRRTLCDAEAEIYYRSCDAFQGKEGQKFAKASAEFWQSKVVGHTKMIGLTQPGQKTLKPGQEPYWSETEGSETPTPKKPIGFDANNKPKKD